MTHENALEASIGGEMDRQQSRASKGGTTKAPDLALQSTASAACSVELTASQSRQQSSRNMGAMRTAFAKLMTPQEQRHTPILTAARDVTVCRCDKGVGVSYCCGGIAKAVAT